MRKKLARWRTWILAEMRFSLSAMRVLVQPGLVALLVALIGAGLLYWLEGLSWGEALYCSYGLLMGELPDRLFSHPVAQGLLYIQPIFGILLIAEGILKLGVQVFNKEANAEAWMTTLAASSRNHIVLCGLGNIGFRTLEELLALNEQVFVLEHNAANPLIAQARALGAHVVVGDARTDNLLRGMNLRAARAVLVLTGDDLSNLEIAMDAREIAPSVPIVMRVYDQRLAEKVKHSIGVSVSVSTSKLAAPLLASSALDRAVVGAHRVGDKVLMVLALRVGGVLAGKTVQELFRQFGLSVVALEGLVQPDGSVVVEAGKSVQVMVESSRIEEVHGLNGG